ncbi:MAG: alpha-ketoacid dehydrogenase subunit beta [Actinomycetales bacterium]|nr:alpha-ketoacid dehydrogenase subunit beta [Actinomycetales bacterium]
MLTLTMSRALNEGLRCALRDDPRVLVMGEDVGALGGVFRVTDGLLSEFGPQRVIDTPLGESGIIGTAVGLAMRGYRPVCEIQFDGFVFPAFDQIVSQVAKLRARTEGRQPMPIVVRIPAGGGIGAVEHHSESPEAYFAHTPGLRVVYPSSPSDAFRMIRQSIALDDPVIFLEPKRCYWHKGEVEPEAELADMPPLLAAQTVRLSPQRGVADGPPRYSVSIVCYGPTVEWAMRAAEAATQQGVTVEVVDLRALSPLDLGSVEASVQRTHRLVVVHEAPGRVGLGAEIAAAVSERCFADLYAPVQRVVGLDIPYPPNRLEGAYLPTPERILDAVAMTLAAA